MTTTIQNIPDELLVEILGKLPKKDLKNARRVCNLWSTAGAKWMFQQVHFAPREVPIKTFLEIAATPAFALNVKELIYDGRLFLPELGNGASYRAAFGARMAEELDTYREHVNGTVDPDIAYEVYQDSIWNVEKLGAGENMKYLIANDCEEYCINVVDSLVRYECLLDQQERILQNGTDFEALREGLTSFRNIKKVGAFVGFADHSDYRFRADDTRSDWYGSRPNLEFGLTVPPSQWCRWQDTQDGMDRKERIKWDVRRVHALFRVVSTHCPSLVELNIGSVLDKAPLTIFELSDPDVEKFRIIARRLRTLELHPYVRKNDDCTEYERQRYCLEVLLQKAKELRMLSSSTWFLDEWEESEESEDGNKDHVWSERVDYGMFCGKVWPHLTKLYLESDRANCVKEGDLMSIIRAHKGSLRELSMAGMSLLGKERWEHFGKEMGRILELHYVRVHGLHDDGNADPGGRRWLPGEKILAFLLDMMQWVPPDLLEIEQHYTTVTGKLKAGSS